MGVDKAKAPFYVLFYYHLLSFHSLILCSNFHDMIIDNCLKLEVSYVIPQGLADEATFDCYWKVMESWKKTHIG
jgi:hypothetical protein